MRLREAKLTLGLVRHAAMRIGQPTGDVLRSRKASRKPFPSPSLVTGNSRCGRWRHSPLWPDRDPRTHPQNRHLLATRPEAAQAIEDARDHLTANDRELKIILPPAPAPMDWNDILQERARC
jgi:hypothetical protein